ncbi:MAG TPA: ATP-binding protein [Bacteroidetes bacterium]|nr:ATP-binding protein [Bacteroidota bacterium]
MVDQLNLGFRPQKELDQAVLSNIAVIAAEIQWLQTVVDTRLRLYFGVESDFQNIAQVLPPKLENSEGMYAAYLQKQKFGFAERILVILALVQHVKPEVLDGFFVRNKTYDRVFTEFGGIQGPTHTGFIPTGETALFLLAGGDLHKRILFSALFDPQHALAKDQVVYLESAKPGESRWNGRLVMAPENISQFTLGQVHEPTCGPDFPARRVSTEMEWKDVILPAHTQAQVMEIQDWITYGPVLLNGIGLGKRLTPGFKALFYGPPGTGKTLTASLLGKATGRHVYKIDLSLVVSKFIGETEKNLAKVFDQAASKNWILFFDEADSLFGKRTELRSSNDRYANQETAYLLQRIESFPGVVLLASNLKDNLDAAFSRRFQAVINFPMPEKKERLALWKDCFSANTPLEEKIDLEDVAEKYAIAGGAMMNIVRYCTVQAVKRGDGIILKCDFDKAIRKELEKDGLIWI